MNILKLHEALSSVASISGVSIGDPEDRTTWRIDFDQNSTEEQKLDAKTLLYAYVEPSSTKTKLYKSTFIRRMSLTEASRMSEILEAEEPWMKLLYNATEYFLVSDALIGYLHLILAEEFGEDRADELLTPEE